VNLLDDNAGKNLGDPGYGDEFLDKTPKRAMPCVTVNAKTRVWHLLL